MRKFYNIKKTGEFPRSNGKSWLHYLLLLICFFQIDAIGQVVISEIHYNPPDIGTEDGLYREFIELHNPSDTAINLSGYFFDNGIAFEFPDNTTLFPQQYIVIAKNLGHTVWRNSAFRIVGHYEGRLANSGEHITLKNPQSEVIESLRYDDVPPWPQGADGYGSSLERIDFTLPADDVHAWRSSTQLGGTPGRQNSTTDTPPYPTITDWSVSPQHPSSNDEVKINAKLDSVETIQAVFLNIEGNSNDSSGEALINFNSTWRYWKGTSPPSDGLDWTELSFNDGNWLSGRAGFGYGDIGRVNTILNDMRGTYSTVFLRKHFSLNELSSRTAFFLDLYYDDGFICYINGREAARENAPNAYTHTSTAAGSHESNTLSTFSLPNTLFQQGDNVIAIVGFNISLGGSSDFVLAPSLRIQHNQSNRIEMEQTSPDEFQATLPPSQSQSIIRTNITVEFEDGSELTLPHSAEPTPFLSYFVYDNEIESRLPLLWIMQPKISPLVANGREYSAAVAKPIGAEHPTLFDGALVIDSSSGRQKVRFIKGSEFFGDRTINIIPEIPTGGTNAGISSPYREHLGYWFYREMGVLSPWGEFYRTIELPINESPQRQQLIFQQINERFLEMNGRNPDADLYKLERRANPNWEKHTNLAEGNTSIDELLESLRRSRRQTIETRFDLDNMLNYSAASIFTSNWDGYWQNNWMYLDPDTMRFEMYPWDLDWIWGATPPPNTGPMYAEMPLSFPIDGIAIGDTNVSRPPGPVTSPMHQDAVYYEAYIERLAQTFNTTFSRQHMFEKMAQDEQRLLDDLNMLQQQTGRNVSQRRQDIQTSYDTIREYILRRRAFLEPLLPQRVDGWALYD